MKFGKSLSNQIEEALPEWRDKFLSYKDLKKRLKLLEANSNPSDAQRVEEGGGRRDVMTEEESEFVRLLEGELEKVNAFFVEKEEEYIIRLKELQDRVQRAKDKRDEMMTIRREIVDFHGEMVLLENYSALNYTGLVKILKKHDKITGTLLRLPFIQKVLEEPFFTTDVLCKLVKECETMLEHTFPSKPAANGNGPSVSSPSEDSIPRAPKDLADLDNMKSMYMKSTLSALRVLKEIRGGSSTVSPMSLPPLQGSLVDDPLNVISVAK